MSFIILILIIIMLYASLTKYGKLLKVLFMSALMICMTTAFLIYGLNIFRTDETFAILNTGMNRTVFVHACIIWYAADLLVILKIIRNYRKYLEVNS